MRPGHRTRLPEGRVDYKKLRKVNAEAARRAVKEYLKTNGNISLAARLFGINRVVVYDIIKKDKEGDLRDRSRALRRQPKKTPVVIGDKVSERQNQGGFGNRDYEATTACSVTLSLDATRTWK